MTMSNYLADKVNDHVLRGVTYTPPTAIWLALFTTMPDRDNVGGVEVVGGSYARLEVTFSVSDDGVTSNTAVLLFEDMPACTVVGCGLFDDDTAGNLLHLGRFSGPVDIAAGTDVPVPIGDIVEVTR